MVHTIDSNTNLIIPHLNCNYTLNNNFTTKTTTNMCRKSILNFKAGKMTTSLQSNGKYLVEPDKRRGELHVVYVSGATGSGGGRVKLEWKDRRTKVRSIVYVCSIVLWCIIS